MALSWQIEADCLRLVGQMNIETLHEQRGFQALFQKPSLPFKAVDLAAVEQMDSAGLACLACWLDVNPNLNIQHLPAVALELAALYNLQNHLSQARS